MTVARQHSPIPILLLRYRLALKILSARCTVRRRADLLIGAGHGVLVVARVHLVFVGPRRRRTGGVRGVLRLVARQRVISEAVVELTPLCRNSHPGGDTITLETVEYR